MLQFILNTLMNLQSYWRNQRQTQTYLRDTGGSVPNCHNKVNNAIKKGTLIFWFASVYNGEGNGAPLQYSCLENPMDRGAWQAAVHGVANSRRRLSDFPFTFHFQALEKEMATHSSVLAWRIPGTGEPGGLPPMGSHRVGHD